MTAHSGSDFILHIGDGGSSETFTALGGMQRNDILVENERLRSDTPSSGPWESAPAALGHQRVTITGSGIFTDSSAEASLHTLAFSKAIAQFKLTFGNGDELTGPFMVTRYQRTGIHDEPERTSLTLISTGAVTMSS